MQEDFLIATLCCFLCNKSIEFHPNLTLQVPIPYQYDARAKPSLLLYHYVPKLNSLSPERCGNKFKSMIFRLLIQNSSLDIRCEIVLMWLTQNLTHDKSTLFQVMAWCRQARSHYLSQFCPRSLSSYDVTMLQWGLMMLCYPQKQGWLQN